MTKIDLDEIEASLGYLEDWKNVLNELRAARQVVEAAMAFYTRYREVFSVEIAPETGVVADLGNAIKKLDEARLG